MDPITATVLAVGSTALSAYGSYQQGRAQDDAARIEAAQLRENAERTAKEGIRRAEEQRRQKAVALSNARAAQAAGGGTTTDPGALGQQGSLAAVFERNALEEIYAANLDADAMYKQSGLRQWEGKVARRTGTTTALATVLSGASSIYRPGTPAGSSYTRPTQLPSGRAPLRIAGPSSSYMNQIPRY